MRPVHCSPRGQDLLLGADRRSAPKFGRHVSGGREAIVGLWPSSTIEEPAFVDRSQANEWRSSYARGESIRGSSQARSTTSARPATHAATSGVEVFDVVLGVV